MRIGRVLVAVTFVCFSEPAAANLGAADLKNYCEKKSSLPDQMYCVGFIQGTLDTYKFTDDALGRTPLGKGIFVCIPDGVPESVVEAIVERHLADHPDSLRFSATSEIGAAIEEAYRCPSKAN